MSTFVVDTVSFINYFNDVFGENEKISNDARRILHNGITGGSVTNIVVPSVVLLEIYYKHLRTEYFREKFLYECYYRIKNNDNIEIKGIEKGVLKALSAIDDGVVNLEYGDKLILASAIELEVPIITVDFKITKYCKAKGYEVIH